MAKRRQGRRGKLGPPEKLPFMILQIERGWPTFSSLYVGRLFDREEIVGLRQQKAPQVPLFTMEAGFRLMLHGLVDRRAEQVAFDALKHRADLPVELFYTRYCGREILHWRLLSISFDLMVATLKDE